MSNLSMLSDAIKSRKQIKFYYDGFARLVEPFVLGRTKKGNLAIRAFQTAGGSNSNTVPGWHLFLVDKIGSLEVTEKSFSGVREFYNPNDKGMTVIYSRI